MADPGVWLAEWTVTAKAFYAHYRCPREEDELQRQAEALNQGRQGNAPPPDDFPKKFIREYDNVALPTKPVFQLCGFPIVTLEAKQLFERFDIGTTKFYPVSIYEDRNEERKYPGGFFHFVLGARKTAFIPEESPSFEAGPLHPGKYWFSALEKENSAVVRETALQGYDIWHDPDLLRSLFFSQAIVDAIKEKKWARWFHLKRCRIKKVH